ASDRAGLHDGDRVDLREHPLEARLAIVAQLMGTEPVHLIVHRGYRTFQTDVHASSVWEDATLWKLPPMVLRLAAVGWFIACALLITLRRWWAPEARMLALVLLCQVSIIMAPATLVLPNGFLRIAFFIASIVCVFAGQALLVALASRFGPRSALRQTCAWIAYASNAGILVGALAFAYGIVTLRIDPVPYSTTAILRGGHALLLDLLGTVSVVSVAIVAALAIASVPRPDRARAAWILLPLPAANVLVGLISESLGLAQTYYSFIGIINIWGLIWCVAAAAVTFALLKRRVLDFEFVLSRALVFATISFVVVAAFVLLEWLLGNVLVNVSHATGLVANAALALLLGLSMNVIHHRVDNFIDTTFFRKRHDAERALRAFSKEAAFVTRSDALLDQAMQHIERYTDASGAALMLDGNGRYEALRQFGNASGSAGENDPAVLALKTWHKPVDPHQYDSALQGALAVPMLGRGRLIGIVVLGERTGNEAYAPDEIDALSEFAHGVGTALDALSETESREDLRAAISELTAEVRAIGARLPPPT
ncbi:MAG: GAF domain-containing protein, partial [Candidatus Eremiobacteraeota bacterium]|nr:GAF domain-containing protein [Candidatus Eremiobacteraeota bacterium]